MHSYGIVVDNTQLALVLLANVELATSKAWGWEFRPALQTIRRAYAYNYAHTSDSITAILRELAGADGVCKLNKAPPSSAGSANAVTNQTSYLTTLLQQQPINDEDGAAYAAQSDSKTIHPNSTSKPKYYVAISNAYATLPQYAADPPDTSTLTTSISPPPPVPIPSTFKLKAIRRIQARRLKSAQAAADHTLIDQHITWAEDERTAAGKADLLRPCRRSIDYAHTRTRKPKATLLQATKNAGYALAANLRQSLLTCLPSAKHVTFQTQAHVRHFNPDNNSPMITYDSGANGHYLSEADRLSTGLPILRPSTK
eukprot:CCRYP_020246-RA/>CCRYP_020246-RA protein AED:0.61 eAED:0.61 QI:0/0/0/0.5/1/1/2/0/312